MLEFYFRQSYQKIFINPVLSVLKNRSIHPSWITLFALITGLSAAPAIALNVTYLALGLVLISGYFDTLDGSLARIKNSASPKGAVLDIVTDRVVEFSIIMGLFLLDPTNRGFASLLMLGSSFICVTTFLVVGLFVENQSNKCFHYSVGLMERFEAFAFFIAMIALPVWFNLLAYSYSALVFITAFLRVCQFLSRSEDGHDKR